MRPFISGSIAALALAFLPVPAHAEQPTPVDPSPQAVAQPLAVDKTAVPAAPVGADDLVAQLPARRTDGFGLVGVTWDRGYDDAGLTVQVRLRTAGTWDDWEELDVEADEGEGGRDGTEPLWVGDADGVAVRVTSPTGVRPTGLSVATIDPGTLPSEAASADQAFFSTTDSSATVQAADGSPTYTPQPTIRSRASWGARKNTYCDSPRTGNETRGIVVHHTAGSNSYSKAQSPAIIRAIQAYHMKSRDWCDIGYNFLVDKYGQIFEGRNGGVSKPVRAAHSGDKTVNTYTMGVAMMGTYSSSQPTAATKSAMVKLIGWRIGTTFHPAKGTYSIGSYRLNRIAGHRNVYATSCPGAAAYAWLSADGGLRDRVEAYVADYSSPIKTKFRELGTDRTGPVYVGEYPFSSDGGGRKARLDRLDLYSSPLGTYAVDGYVRQTYSALDAQSGVLGVPASDKQTTPRDDVTLQRFRSGTVYRVQTGSTAAGYAVWGSLENTYVDRGEVSGELGAPTRSMRKFSDGRYRAYFEHGYITRLTDKTITVTMR